MKNYKVYLAALCLFLTGGTVLSQEMEEIILIREDIVRPSETSAYEYALMQLKQSMEDLGMNDFVYYTHLHDNFHYSHAIPLRSWAEMDRDFQDVLAAKMGAMQASNLLSGLNDATISRKLYALKFHPDLSYVPEGDDWDEATYRKWTFAYVQPGAMNAALGLIEEWKALYQKEKVAHGYRIFEGVVGTENPLIVFSTWAKDPGDHSDRIAVANELLGDEGGFLYDRLMVLLQRVETVEGWYLPQYSHIPTKEEYAAMND